MNTIRIIVSGAAGRMGRAAIRAISADSQMELVGAVGHSRGIGQDAGTVAGAPPLSVLIGDDLVAALDRTHPDVLVEFAPGRVAVEHAQEAITRGVRPVIGATGLGAQDVSALTDRARAGEVGAVIAPNFALGAVLMMTFSRRAARFFPHVEVIELHHDRKRDAPSGTAVKTAQMIAEVRGEAPPPPVQEEETLPGARGATGSGGIRVHSVRLPGLIAHQEVIFGGPGQTLTIRHDSVSEESFMPGLLLAVRRVPELHSLVYGLENLLDV